MNSISIDDYKNMFEQQKYNRSFLVGIIFIMTMILFILIIGNLSYQEYYMDTGMVVDNNKIKITCEVNNCLKIIDNQKLYLDKYYSYDVLKIDNLVFKNNSYFQDIYLLIDFESKVIIKNSILSFKILINEVTVKDFMRSIFL